MNDALKITGYRNLSPVEVSLINTIKEHGMSLNQLVLMVTSHVDDQRHATDGIDHEDDMVPERTLAQEQELARINRAEPNRWANIARTHFQEGLMALTRAVAQPSDF